jgi:predicted porin
MKKSLLALAVLGAFAGVAQAQTSVTIYGSFDAGVRSVNNVDAAGNSRLTMGSSGTYNSNRLGFRGVEDLGGGMNAHFTLENGFNTGNGAAVGDLFARSAFVGLGGAWGSVDLGRQYSVNFKTIGAYDPFAYKYTGIIPLAGIGGLTRLNNDIQYTGAFGPVTVRAEYALGEVAGDTGAGATAALGAGFKTGPFSFGGAYTTRANTTDTADQDVWTLGGAFATGPFRIAAGYADDDRDAGFAAALPVTVEIRDAWLGGSYNITPAMALQAGWYHTRTDVAGVEGRRNLAIVGATYNLSKRTNFYADVDHSRFKDAYAGAGAVPGQDRVTGISVGVNHLF